MTPVLFLKYSVMILGDLFVLLVLGSVALRVITDWMRTLVRLYFEEKFKLIEKLENRAKDVMLSRERDVRFH